MSLNTYINHYMVSIRDQNRLYESILRDIDSASRRTERIINLYIRNLPTNRLPSIRRTRPYRRLIRPSTPIYPPPTTIPPPPPTTTIPQSTTNTSTNTEPTTTTTTFFQPNFFPTIPNSFFSTIPIRPTQTQINNATTISLYSDISNNQTSCPISMEEFLPSDQIIQINHCKHIFKVDNLTHWFASNSSCPVCRFDIRDDIQNTNTHTTNTTNTTNTTTTPSSVITDHIITTPITSRDPTTEINNIIQSITDSLSNTLNDPSNNIFSNIFDSSLNQVSFSFNY